MNKLLTILFAGALLCSGCDSRNLTFVSNLKLNRMFMVDNTGPFTDSWTIQPSDVKGDLNIPSDAKVDKVTIESISIKVVIQERNNATGVNINGGLNIDGHVDVLFNDYPAPFELIDDPLVGLNSLLDDKVQAMRARMEQYLKQGTGEPFSVVISGTPTPPDERLNVDIYVNIKGSVTYHQCVDVPMDMIGGEKCTE